MNQVVVGVYRHKSLKIRDIHQQKILFRQSGALTTVTFLRNHGENSSSGRLECLKTH